MAGRFYTPYDIKRTNLHILTARGMSHIFGSNWPTWRQEKKLLHAYPKPRFENYESVQHRLQFSGIKKGSKISFHRHFKEAIYILNYDNIIISLSLTLSVSISVFVFVLSHNGKLEKEFFMLCC